MNSHTKKNEDSPRRCLINDTTLRDGEQMPGIFFSENEKIQICEKLLEIGVNDIEVGCAAILHHEPTYLEYLKSKDSCRFSIWCRADDKDVEQAAELGFGKIHISFPVSDFQLDHMKRDRSWVIRTAQRILPFVRRNSQYISVGAQDATRADPFFLETFADVLNFFGVRRLRFSDTVGIATPVRIQHISRYLSKRFSGTLEFHGHNDLGLAVANCITAFQSGVDEISTTVNGIGERAGNAAMEQVVTAAYYGLQTTTNIELSQIQSVCEMISNYSKIPIPINNPITGKLAFCHESGIHFHGQLKHPLMYQPFSAEDLGRKSEFSLGRLSGSASVCEYLNQNGIVVSRQIARKVISCMREIYPQKATYDLSDVMHALSLASNHES